MDIQQLHQLIDDWASKQSTQPFSQYQGAEIKFTAPEEPKRELLKDKRVIRTKSTGDRVYLIDEVAKTKAWVTSAEILDKLGFTMTDVEEVDDSALVGYAMTASIYKI